MLKNFAVPNFRGSRPIHEKCENYAPQKFGATSIMVIIIIIIIIIMYFMCNNILRTIYVHVYAGIVYCLSRNNAEEVCRELCRKGISAGCYHADCLPGDRTRVHTEWLNNTLQVSVRCVCCVCVCVCVCVCDTHTNTHACIHTHTCAWHNITGG